MDTNSRIKELFAVTDIPVTEDQIDKLSTLVELLVKWNKSLNLTAIRKPEDMVVLHIMDSAVISPLLKGNNIADVGTGPGFPGLVLAVLNPDISFTLIDSVAKKLSFVRTAMVTLKLENVKIINDRCENIVLDKKFDCIVSRAFASLYQIVEWCLPLLDKEKGIFLAMKGDIDQDELKAVPQSVRIKSVIELKVPDLNAKRQAVIMEAV